MDAVILAGGRGLRMRGVAAEFCKPLLPVDGVPLICRAVDLAHAADVAIPVVVVAPRNAEAIERALGDRHAVLVVQRRPKGPGHALALGLGVTTRPTPSDRVLVLLADNVSADADVAAVASHPTAIGVKAIARWDAERFTRYENGRWIEKQPLGRLDGPPVSCWVGPFVGDRELMTEAVYRERLRHSIDEPETETPVGPLLAKFMRPRQHNLVEVSSYDIGTLEAYLGDHSE